LARDIGRARHAAAASVVATSHVTGNARGARDWAWALPRGAIDSAGSSVAAAGARFSRGSSVRAALGGPAAARNGRAAARERGPFVGAERVRVLQTGREHQRNASQGLSRSTVETKRSRGPRVARHSRRRVCHFGDAA
jgi:hypothetical protein